MADSMSEMLRQDMQCEGLLECFHDLKAIDRDVFELLHESDGALTVDAIAETIDRERSTAYRSVQRLLTAGFIRKEQVNYEQGGYYHVYRPRDVTEITREMQQLLDDWYAQIGRLISDFDEKYGEQRPIAE